MLSTGDLQGMRATLEQSLPGTAVIQTLSLTPDGMGGGTSTWTAAGTVDCRLTRLSSVRGDEAEHGDRIAPEADWMLTLPAETQITTEDRVVVGGVTFTVSAMHAPRSWEISRRVELVEET